MGLTEKTREELFEFAKKLELNVAKNIDTEKLRDVVERAAIERTMKLESEVRENLKQKSELRRQMAEIKASAELAKIPIEIPAEPTIDDVVRLKKELGLKEKEPKPSPETLAIEASEKVYALFRNLEEEDVDVVAIPGGKHRFHFLPDKIHVLPEWLIRHYRSEKNPSGKRPRSEYKEVVGDNVIAARMTQTVFKPRFSFEILGDAPKDAPFGVVIDPEILAKLEQPI